MSMMLRMRSAQNVAFWRRVLILKEFDINKLFHLCFDNTVKQRELHFLYNSCILKLNIEMDWFRFWLLRFAGPIYWESVPTMYVKRYFRGCQGHRQKPVSKHVKWTKTMKTILAIWASRKILHQFLSRLQGNILYVAASISRFVVLFHLEQFPNLSFGITWTAKYGFMWIFALLQYN